MATAHTLVKMQEYIFLWLTLTLAKNGRQSINSLKVMVDYVQALENCIRPP